jgi:hypothetical protein
VFVVLEKEMKLNHLKWMALVSAVLCSAVQAQAPIKEKPPAKPLVKPLVFDSAFAAYQPYIEQDIQSWRKANDVTAERGGWRAYLKESQIHQARVQNLPRVGGKP